jgi:hypothetical protein
MYEQAAAEYIIYATFEYDKQALQEGIVPDAENNSHRQVENNSQRQRQHNYYAATHNENDKVGLNISVSMPY